MQYGKLTDWYDRIATDPRPCEGFALVVSLIAACPMSAHERRRRGSGVRVFATAENRQRGPSLGAGAGLAGAGRDASPPGLAGGAGRGSDGAAPVVVGALDWLSLARSVQLYPIVIPRIARMTTSAASQGHIDPPLPGASRSRRRFRSAWRGSVSRGSDMLLLLSLNRRDCVEQCQRLIAHNVPVDKT